MMQELSRFDIGAVCISLTLLFLYHLNLYLVSPGCFGTRIPFGVNLKNAAMWIKKHKDMNDTPTALLAVHTLRNTTMTAVFIGANAVIVAYNISNSYEESHSPRKKIRALIIMALMFASFICWAHVARLCSVLSYMIGTLQYSEQLREEAYALERGENNGIYNTNNTNTTGIAISTSTITAIEMKKKKELEDLALKPPSRRPSWGSEVSSIASNVGAVPRKSLQAFKNKFEEFEKSGDYRIQKFESSQIPKVFEQGSQLMGMMTIYFSCGFRLMFAAIPFAFYIAGPLALVIATAGLLFMLRSYDYMRRVRGIEKEEMNEGTEADTMKAQAFTV